MKDKFLSKSSDVLSENNVTICGIKRLTIVKLNHLQRLDFALANLGDFVHHNWTARHKRWLQLLQYGTLAWLVDLG